MMQRLGGGVLLASAVVLTLWQAVTWLSRAPHHLLLTPEEVGRAGWRERARLATAVWITGREAAGALVASGATRALAATASVRWRGVGWWLLSAATLAQTVPLVALAPLILLWVGSGARAVTLIAAIIAFFPALHRFSG